MVGILLYLISKTPSDWVRTSKYLYTLELEARNNAVIKIPLNNHDEVSGFIDYKPICQHRSILAETIIF